MLAGFHVVAKHWNPVDTLPDGLDPAQAVVYQAVEGGTFARLGGRQFVFEDGQVWWQQPDGLWKSSIFKAGDFQDAANWEPVTA